MRHLRERGLQSLREQISNSPTKLKRLSKFAICALVAVLIITGLAAASIVTAQAHEANDGFSALTEVPKNFTIVYPLMAARRTSQFGPRTHPVHRVVRHHNGVDLAAPDGTPIRAIKNGVVVFADPHGAYGNLIVIKHKGDYTSHYGHCSKVLVRTGQQIRAGQIIGEVGATGKVTGAHLHLEIRKDGKPLDPDQLITKLAERAQG